MAMAASSSMAATEQLLQVDPAMAAYSILAIALVTLVLITAANRIGGGGSGKQQRRHGLPPSPRRLPVIGHLHLLRPPVHRTFQELASRLGAPLMHIRLGSTHCLVASSAAAATELIRSHEGKISERPLTAVARQFAYGSDSGFAFAPYGPHWRAMKRLCMSELLGPRTVELLRPVRRAGLISLLHTIVSSLPEPEQAVDLTAELIRMSNASIIRMMASTVPGSVTEEAQALVKAVAELVGAFNVEDYIAVCRGWDLQGLRKRAADVHRRFDALLEDMIAHKEEARAAKKAVRGEEDDQEPETKKTVAESKDLIDILLDKVEDETAAEETKLTREKIKAFTIDVVTAGSDTSAAMVEWMLAELMNHPECLSKVRDEIDAVVGSDRIAGEADIPNMPYLQAAYKETLRLRPAAPIAHRQSTEDMELATGGCFTVPAGTAVFINLWAIGRDPEHWGETALEFRPERFMPGGENEKLEPRGQHFQYLPFGSGRRGCPGMGLALQSVPAVVAALVQCFHWTVVPKAGEEKAVIDMEESDGLVCARKHPLLLRAEPRLNPFPAVV